jgi:DNA-binding HxlR family transcriptional regulator
MVMRREPTDPTQPETGCPLTAALGTIGGKWTLIVVYWIKDEPKRFAELRRLMPEISHKVLTETLRQLEDAGLVVRSVLAEMPPHVEYALSAYGQSVLPVLEAVRGWGQSHLERRQSGA